MQTIREAVSQAVQDLFSVEVDIDLSRPDEQFGDYSTNVAMQLAAQLNSKPQEIAQALANKLADHELFADKPAVAGPGFLNFKVADEALWQLAGQKPSQSLADQTVVAEYSDPNPFKALHAGHLYTTLVGDAIARLLEQAGATVHRVNFGGDVGLHVARSMWGILQTLGGEKPAGLEQVPVAERATWLSARYVEGTAASESDETAQQAIAELNKKIYQLHEDNDHESAFARIYWTCREWSYDGFNQFYKRLQVTPFEKYYPESVTTPGGVKLVKEGLQKRVFEESDGAVVFRGEQYGLHTRVFLTSAGLPTYEAKDLGLAAAKWQDYHFDLSVIITANEIAEYMKVVMRALQNFYPEPTERTKHLTHGLVKLAGGVKMSSRKGNVLSALDVLASAETAAKQVNEQAGDEVVLAAVKFAFLKQRIGGDIIYDPVESVALEGNSGPYLQYAHARARSILSKAEAPIGQQTTALEAGERTLLRKLGEYAEVVDKAVAELMPHHICTYLYELAQVFNRFYEGNRVVGDPRQAIRLQLVEQYAQKLKDGLAVLNIKAPDRM